MSPRIPFLDELRSELITATAPTAEVSSRPPKRSRLRGPAIALVTFGLVLLVGVLVVLLRGPAEVAQPEVIEWDLQIMLEPLDDPELFIAEIEAMAAVAETEYFADASEIAAFLPTADIPGLAVLLIRLAEGANEEGVIVELTQREDVLSGIMLSPDIGERRVSELFERAARDATLLGEEPLVLQPAPGPELRFDPSSLGRHIPLRPAQPGDDIVERIHDGVSFAIPSRPPDETRPILHLGRVEEIDDHLLIFPTSENAFCVGARRFLSCGDPRFSSYGVNHTAGTGPDSGFATVAVPPDTAVVVFASNDGERLWQQPVAGWALFPAGPPPHQAHLVEAYDSDGNQIGLWERRLGDLAQQR